MNLTVSNNDSRVGRVFYRELCFSLLSGNSRNGSGQMLAVQHLHVFDLKGLQVNIIETKHGDAVVQREAQHESLQKLCSSVEIEMVLAICIVFELDLSGLEIHSY